MAQPYVGEIRMFGGNFAPAGWMFCNGATLPISENDTLYTLIGTTYGGDGQETFNLPNLESRIPLHFGTGPDGTTYQIAEMAGVEQVTLTTQQIPVHSHAYMATTVAGNDPNPTNNLVATAVNIDLYRQTSASTQMAPQAVGPAGGSQPHENTQPFLCINFIISLYGIFPSQT